MSGDDLVAVTVRLPQAQVDALDQLAEQGEIPNRSEGIRSGLGFALDSEEWEVSDDAKALAAFARTKRLSKVHFYREGFQQMCRRVLQAVGSTSPPWAPEQVERTAPKVFEDQIRTLFDTEERREQARQALQEEIDRYAEAYMDEEPDDGNPYVEAFNQAARADDAEWVHEWEQSVEEIVPDAIKLLADPANDPEDVKQALAMRQGVDSDRATDAVEKAQAQRDLGDYEREVEAR